MRVILLFGFAYTVRQDMGNALGITREVIGK